MVRRSSTSRTGSGASAAARVAAHARVLTAAGPSPPDSERGSPTTTSTASSLGRQPRDPAQVALAPPHRLDRGRQEPGRVAARDADPGVAGVDAEPYAVSHRPRSALATSRPTWSTSERTSVERLVDAARVAAAALGDVVLAAAAAADERADRADERVGAQASRRAPRR